MASQCFRIKSYDWRRPRRLHARSTIRGRFQFPILRFLICHLHLKVLHNVHMTNFDYLAFNRQDQQEIEHSYANLACLGLFQ